MAKLKQWSDFNKNLINWSNEIDDLDIRLEYLNYCADRLESARKRNYLIYWSIDEEKQKLCNDFGKYIPSLVQEVREMKLNKLIYDRK